MLSPTLKFAKIRRVISPDRAHSLDAGIDFYVPTDFQQKGLEPGEAVRIKSGIKVNIPQGYALVAFNKSGISTKLGLIVGACVIDSGYQGEISIHFINTSNKKIWIIPDMKVVQYILLPIAESIPEEVKESELFPHKSTRGDGGFGSSNIVELVGLGYQPAAALNPIDQGLYDDDPNPYSGNYSET